MKFKDELQRQLYYHGQIDYCYWRIAEISKIDSEKTSPIHDLIDKVSGYEASKVLEKSKEIKYLTSVIIRCKARLGFDNTKDKQYLYQIRKLEKQLKK